MAGKPGQGRGGAREGAGRPAKPQELLEVPATDDPLQFLLSVMNDSAVEPRLRVRAAITASQYKHTKRGDGGKKDEKEQAAKAAGAGKFSPAAPPKLVVNNR